MRLVLLVFALLSSGCTAFVELHPWGKPPDVTSPRPAPGVCRATPEGVCVPAGVLPPSPAPGGDK